MPGIGQAFRRAEQIAAGSESGPELEFGQTHSEWPTWTVLVAVYAGWFALTYHAAILPWWLVLPAGAWLTAWHGSLQHESIHGHPTRSPRINAALAWPPFGLWMPYSLYRETHEQHHASAHLTSPAPGVDPESFYVSPEDWARMGRLRRAIHFVNQTLAGRLVLGPALIAGRFWLAETRRLLGGDLAHARTWAGHAVGVALVLGWTSGVCGLPVLEYVAMFAWPGLSLTLLRSFAEHEPSADGDRRTAIIASGPVGGLLYLNNNLHAVHHAYPGLAWHALPAVWGAQRNRFSGPDGPPFHRGYAAIARRYLFNLRDHPVHPG